MHEPALHGRDANIRGGVADRAFQHSKNHQW